MLLERKQPPVTKTNAQRCRSPYLSNKGGEMLAFKHPTGQRVTLQLAHSVCIELPIQITLRLIILHPLG